VDRHPGRAQGVDVPVHGPFGNLQTLGELARGEAAASLEQEEQGEDPIGSHSLFNDDTGCQQLGCTLAT
jgi:hypothetical protein